MDAYITEVMAQQLANEVSIYVYEFEVEDPLKKFEGVSAIYWKWKRANQYMPMGYNQSTIASLEPVQHFAGHEPLSIQQKTIDTSNNFEKTLLEKLIKDSLLVTGQQKLNLKRVGTDLQEWQPNYPYLTFERNPFLIEHNHYEQGNAFRLLYRSGC